VQNAFLLIEMFKHIVKDNEIVSGVIERESVIVQTPDGERNGALALQRVGDLNASRVNVEPNANGTCVVHGTDTAAFPASCVEKTPTFDQRVP
jgi:hypothetical protein